MQDAGEAEGATARRNLLTHRVILWRAVMKNVRSKIIGALVTVFFFVFIVPAFIANWEEVKFSFLVMLVFVGALITLFTLVVSKGTGNGGGGDGGNGD